MKLLAVDTATETCGVALMDDGGVAGEFSLRRRTTHARHLMGLIERLLRSAGTTADELTGLAVTVGPGTFTGLRIGLSTVKGLAVAAGLPVAPVSSLEVLAVQTGPGAGTVCPMIDARRGEVYAARYHWVEPDRHGPVASRTWGEAVATPEAAVENLAAPAVIVGSGAEAHRGRLQPLLGSGVRIAQPLDGVVRPAVVALLGLRCFERGDGLDPSDIRPRYLRKSDAELNRSRGRSS